MLREKIETIAQLNHVITILKRFIMDRQRSLKRCTNLVEAQELREEIYLCENEIFELQELREKLPKDDF